MKMLLAALLLITSSLAWGNLHLAPPDFSTKTGRAVFIDFKKAHYEVTYNIRSRKTTVKSTITFEAKKTGNPVFDLVPSPKSVRLNGEEVGQKLTSVPG